MYLYLVHRSKSLFTLYLARFAGSVGVLKGANILVFQRKTKIFTPLKSLLRGDEVAEQNSKEFIERRTSAMETKF